MISQSEITETIRMIESEKLDIRTITLGISLRDCADSDGAVARRKIYDKITYCAKNLVRVGDEISIEYGIPIINKRIAVTPISIVAEPSGDENYVAFAQVIDQAAQAVGVNFIGGFTALVHKGFTKGDMRLMASIPEALATTERVCSSVNLATTKSGINMDAVKHMGEIIKETAFLTREKDSLGCAKLMVLTNAVEDNPFMAGAFHGPGEAECSINIGISGPGAVKAALEKVKDANFDTVAECVKKVAFKITRLGQLVAYEASKRLRVPFGIVDVSLAPTPAIGDSVARILEEMGLESFGAPGSTAALALLNDAVKKGGIMASSHVGGLSGAFIPVSEDEGIIAAVEKGALNIEKLEAMTCVCSVGLDMIAIAGDTSPETISAIIADEAAIGIINNKTTAVRIIPVWGKKVGEWAEFGGLLGRAPIMEVSKFSSRNFIQRGGRIPAPITSLKN
ncbi:MAG: PFL family protein [bacterium]|nr:PFL family protein [bacterium]